MPMFRWQEVKKQLTSCLTGSEIKSFIYNLRLVFPSNRREFWKFRNKVIIITSADNEFIINTSGDNEFIIITSGDKFIITLGDNVILSSDKRVIMKIITSALVMYYFTSAKHEWNNTLRVHKWQFSLSRVYPTTITLSYYLFNNCFKYNFHCQFFI